MLFTKASEYALLSLIYISKQTTPQDVVSLSTELNISKSFLAKVLQTLAKEGILLSYKGAKGGFVLSKSPSDITIKQIVDCAEKKSVGVFECSGGVCPSNKDATCSIFPMLNKLQNKIDDFLNNLTLQDILES